MHSDILILAPYVSEAFAGTAHATVSVANELSRRGRVVDLFAFDATERVAEQVRCSRLPEPRSGRFTWRFGRIVTVRDYIRALRAARLPRAALVYTRSMELLLAFRALDTETPVVSHFGHVLASHEARAEGTAREPWKTIDALLADRHERACYRLPRCRHFVSTRMVAEERERMLDLPKGFFDVQPLGVDVSRFAPAGHRANMRASLGATDKTCIIVTVARFVALKNHAWTIRALEKLPEHVTVVLVGDGPQRATLERSIPAALRPRIHFVGQQDPVPYLEAADVFALPSRVESFGIAYAEAMAMGLPCVGLRHRPPFVLSSAEEVIGSDACGLVVADEQEYLTALRKLTDDPGLRKRMGAVAQARCYAHFTIHRYVDAIDAEWVRATSSKHSSASTGLSQSVRHGSAPA